MVIPHNFYELGGGRKGYDRTYDCSSLVGRLLGVEIPFTTCELHIHSLLNLKAIRSHTSHSAYDLRHLLFTKLFSTLSRYLKPTHIIDPTPSTLKIRDPQKDIKPGMLMSTRVIEVENPDKLQQTIGVKGHTAFVASEPRCDGSLWTGGCDRRLSLGIDGIGYAHTSVLPTQKPDITSITHFFEVKRPRPGKELFSLSSNRYTQPFV